MKTAHRTHVFMTTLGAALLLAASFAGAASSAEKSPAPADPATSHSMFMGLDLSVPYQEKTLPIIDVSDDSMIVSSEAKLLRVPTSERNFRLHVKHTLKVSDGAATIGEFTAEPGFSPEKDPYRKFEKAAGGAGGTGAMIDLATVGMRGEEMALAAVTAVATASGQDVSAAGGSVPAMNIANSTSAMVSAIQAGTSDQFQVGTYQQMLQEELAEGNYDALDIAFTINSPEELTAPWIAVLVNYRNRDRPQEDVQTWIVTKALAPIGPKTKRVRFKQIGMPLGFLIQNYQVHLYNKGVEIATTEAPMRTVVSEEEAFQFRVIDYISSHEDATLPAAPAAGQLSQTLREHLTSRYANKPVYVRVLATGRAERAYADKVCKTPIEDTELESLLTRVRFNPALEKGKPVKGVVMLVGKPS